ncbi:MAG: tagatose 1,6-diphosphate aldolase [Candidatus Acidiferrum sp.]|jgi:tagatose 1,6-diphosphate aldolase
MEQVLPLSPGKQSGLQALADERGVIAALAIDQRSALRKLFAKASGRDANEVPAEWLVQFKEKVSQFLTPYASAILLDPEYGLRAASRRSKNTGLLLAYEQSGYDKSVPGRLPRLLDDFTAKRLKNSGADAVKVLLYYSPFSDAAVNEHKQAWVTRVGAECREADLPFFLEIVSYHDQMDEKSAEFARIKPDVVTRSIEEFCEASYAVDVLKVGVPVNMAFVESANLPRSQAAYSRSAARSHFKRASQAASLPFIYLSEGVTNQTFADALTLAAEAGSDFCGVLCGRAIWQDGVPVLVNQGAPALDDWLQEQGARNIQNVNIHLTAARPWFEKIGAAPSARK